MADRKISELDVMGTIDRANDYAVILDVSDSEMKRCIMQFLYAADDDFNTLLAAAQTVNSDSILIWDTSASDYRKVPIGVFTSPELVAIKGYYLGGQITGGTHVATADKLNIVTETCSVVATANLSVARSNCCAITWENAEVGYVFGGNTGIPVVITDKISFATQITLAYPQADTVHARYSSGAGGTGSVASGGSGGYIVGGARPYAVADTEYFSFSIETCTIAASTNLSQARYNMGWINNDFYHGYFFGGASDGPTYYATCERLEYSTGLVTIKITGNLSLARSKVSSSGDGHTKGYILGGTTNNPVNTADKFVISTEITSAQASANLITARYGMSGISQGPAYGYHSGGFDVAVSSVTERVVAVTDVTAVVAGGALITATENMIGISTLYF